MKDVEMKDDVKDNEDGDDDSDNGPGPGNRGGRGRQGEEYGNGSDGSATNEARKKRGRPLGSKNKKLTGWS